MKTKYIHIGFPKAASTTLQNDFFSKHPQLYHLGFGHRNANGIYDDYIDEDINKALEIDLRCKKDLLFDYKNIMSVFNRHFIKAEKMDEKKLVGISFEALSYTNINDIDITQKAERLKYIFGQNTKIIMIVREQRNAIKSFYSNSVLTGYYKSYKSFIVYQLLYQFRSLISDFKYFDIYKLYSNIFGKENVIVLPFELLKNESIKFQKLLCDFLDINCYDLDFSQANTGHTRKSIQCNRLLNYFFRHNLGKPHMTDVYSYRYLTYFKNKISQPTLEKIMLSKKRSAKNANMSRIMAKIPFVPPCNFDVINNYTDDFRKLFSTQNQLLSSEIGFNLSNFGYLVD